MANAIVNQQIQLDNKTYRQYASMLKKAAWSAQRNYGIDYEDALSKAHEIFVEAVSSYEFGKAKFSTHLTTNLLKLSHMANPNSAENQAHASCLLFSTPVREGNDEDKYLEDSLGTEDSAFVTKNLWDWMAKCSTDDSRELAWQIMFGDINHDKSNYVLNANVPERRIGGGRPKKGEVVVKVDKSIKLQPVHTDISVQDCFDKWANFQGWSIERTTLAFGDLKFIINQMKGE
jgi:hypothetical protein